MTQERKEQNMLYNDFKEIKLSALGMGTMRLPVKGDGELPVDEEQTSEMIAYALEHGINYFDTAYGYHAYKSEEIVGRILGRYPRDSFYLATKFPGYDLQYMDKIEKIFEEQLKKCGVDYFDFYLCHNVYEKNIGPYLDEKNGIKAYLIKEKEAGRIKHLGFSVHGSMDVMKQFLDGYGDIMEFCQLQLNYLDWKFQDAKAKAELLNGIGMPIWVMEPLRGGRLAALTDDETAQLHKMRPDESAAAWAFRFLQTVPGVTMTLTGASNFEQLKENIAVFEKNRPLDEHETAALLKMAEGMLEKETLPCTSCHYCASHCPQELDIAGLLSLYNEFCFTNGGGFIAPMAVAAMPEGKRPSACIGCRSCEEVCPQQLKISEAMADFAEKLNGSPFFG